MTPLQEQYTELNALVQLYLLQEFPKGTWLPADPDHFAYFKQHALQQQKKAQQQAPVQIALVPVPVSSSIPIPIPVPAPVSASVSVPVPVPEQPPILRQKSDTDTGTGTEKETGTETNSETNSGKETNSGTGTGTGRRSLSLEPMAQHQPIDVSDFRAVISEISERFPGLKMIDEIPDDTAARNIKNGWQRAAVVPEVILLSFNETPRQLAFLSNVARAIQLRLGPAAVMQASKIEQAKGWDALLESTTLKLVVAPDYGIYMLPELTKHYRESHKQAQRFLGKVPLCLLSDVSLYLREPQLKPALWKALCTLFGK